MDTLSRMRQLVGTTAEWAANDLVIGNGEIAVERVSASQIKIKVGDGVSQFSVLPYVAGGTTGAAGAAATSLPLTGGTLTGPLILPAGAPTGLQALAKDEADKLYVLVANLLAASVGAASAGKVPKLNAAGKLDASFLSISGGMNFKGSTDPTVATPPAAAAAGDFYFASKNATLAAGWTGLAGAAVKAGDSLLFDGANWHSLSGIADLTGFVAKTGDTMTGPLHVVATPTAATEATSKGYVDTELAKKSDTTHTHNYLPLAGGTVTGPITLPAAAPTGDQAMSKKAADDAYLKLAGGAVTGAVSAAPLVDNDLSFDLAAKNNFTCTPTAAGTLTFTNITAGHSGFVLITNTGNFAIAAAATTKMSKVDVGRISKTGTYLVAYYTNATNAYCVVSDDLS